MQPLLAKHEATIDRHLAEMRTTATDFASLHFNKCGPTHWPCDNLQREALVDKQSVVVAATSSNTLAKAKPVTVERAGW